ncbi:MAG: hypothetical protein DME22_09320 [Verrucomicrobia bacterium]|nr:MAG: hypothetical protein DME22_09320 [Verrucomicrobiota bacterium]PYJ99082.1 MAG: hypothetical protein DME23_10505 [Verrucomicrobiota bacterium]
MSLLIKIGFSLGWLALGYWLFWAKVKLAEKEEDRAKPPMTINAPIKAPVGTQINAQNATFNIGNAPSNNFSLPDLFDELERRKATPEPLLTRTFSLLREKGATISLGPCPGEKCMEFKLGDLRPQNGGYIQEIFLSGDGLGMKKPANSKYLIEIDNPIRVQGAALKMELDGSRNCILLNLKRDSFFELFTKNADIKFTVLNDDMTAFKIKLEVKPPSGFRLLDLPSK